MRTRRSGNAENVRTSLVKPTCSDLKSVYLTAHLSARKFFRCTEKTNREPNQAPHMPTQLSSIKTYRVLRAEPLGNSHKNTSHGKASNGRSNTRVSTPSQTRPRKRRQQR